jgi:hypothetical protein
MASTATSQNDKNAEKVHNTTADERKKKNKRKAGDDAIASASVDKKARVDAKAPAARGSMQAHAERCAKRKAAQEKEEAEAKKAIETAKLADQISTVYIEQHELQVHLDRLRKEYKGAPAEFFQWAADIGSIKLARCSAPLEKFNLAKSRQHVKHERAIEAAKEYRKVLSSVTVAPPEFTHSRTSGVTDEDAEAAGKAAAHEFYVYLRELSAWKCDNKASRGDVLMPTIRGPYSVMAMTFVREAYLAMGYTDMLNAELSQAQQPSDVRKNPPVPPGFAWSADSANWVVQIVVFILEYSHRQRVFYPQRDPTGLGFAVGPDYASDRALLAELSKCTIQCPHLSYTERLKIANTDSMIDDESHFVECAKEALDELKKESRKRHGRPPINEDESDHSSDDDPCSDEDAELDDNGDEDEDADDDAGCPSG